MTLHSLLFVGAGGFLGAIARYVLSLWIDARLGSLFPWATLAINVAGSFALGALAGSLQLASVPPEVRLALGVGFLGAFTTFSTFSYETVKLVEAGAAVTAIAYVVASFALALVAAVLGLALGRSL
ncbi:MAG: fluoride efflux transporter CrcB [Thermodesulfobacteriota bacterium]